MTIQSTFGKHSITFAKVPFTGAFGVPTDDTIFSNCKFVSRKFPNTLIPVLPSRAF